MTPQQLAKRIAEAKADEAGLREAMVQLLEAVGTITTAVWYDVGPGGLILVVSPGYGPLDNPENYLSVATRA